MQYQYFMKQETNFYKKTKKTVPLSKTNHSNQCAASMYMAFCINGCVCVHHSKTQCVY